MNNPLVSIIVPVYNVQNSVARCLESICAQTWKDIEVILVNDGSRDESFSICEQFREKDPRIVLVDKSNSGVSETRNCGMSLARGKYVQFVDSDDYLDPDFTERLVTAAEANNADLVIAPYWMVIPANSSKATQALENLQENLGIDAEKKPDDIREYGFLPEGIYEAAATDRRSVEGYTYTLNALQSNVVVSAASWSEGMTVDLNLVASRAGQILIKEIYSGGCQKDDGSGAYQFDKYMIICNNSDQRAEIRNFCVGMTGPYNANAAINNYVDGI